MLNAVGLRKFFTSYANQLETKVIGLCALIICLILFCFCPRAFCSSAYTYIGADLQLMRNNMQSGYGGNFFKNGGATQYNFFIGHYFISWFGFELGYAFTNNMRANIFVPAMTTQFAQTYFTGIASNVFASKNRFSEYSLNYVPSFKLHKRLIVIPLLGLAMVKPSATLTILEFDGASATAQDQYEYNAYFAAKKLIPSLGLRLQYWILQHLALRASYIWQQTSLLQPKAYRNIDPTQELVIKIGNSSTIGIGVVLKL